MYYYSFYLKKKLRVEQKTVLFYIVFWENLEICVYVVYELTNSRDCTNVYVYMYVCERVCVCVYG